MSESPSSLPGLDPDEFVGGPPTGEDDPGGFTSGDQSTAEPEHEPGQDQPGQDQQSQDQQSQDPEGESQESEQG